MQSKPRLAMYWAASCGGCEIALVNLHERLLEVEQQFDFMFCPCLMDTKKKDLENLPDRGIAVTLFNGSIRTTENLEMARLLRVKSELLIAFGSCAVQGGIPALSNLCSREEQFRANYLVGPSVANPEGIRPLPASTTREGELELPGFFDHVWNLAEMTTVDYYVPGCPPEPSRIWDVIEAVMPGKALPPAGSILGAGNSTVCKECSRRREEKARARFHRPHEIIADTSVCLLEQGIVCMGVATRDGCGALCPAVNMPCTGCYGAPDGVLDQGGKMLGALGSALETGDYRSLSEESLAENACALAGSIPDMAGTLYRYGLRPQPKEGGA